MLAYIKKLFIKYFTPSFITTESYEKYLKNNNNSLSMVSGTGLNENIDLPSWRSVFEDNINGIAKHQELDLDTLHKLTTSFHNKIVNMQQSVLLRNNINIDTSNTNFKDLTKIIKSSVENSPLSNIKVVHKTKELSENSSYTITKTINSEDTHPIFYHIRVMSGKCVFKYTDKLKKEQDSFVKHHGEDFIFGVKNNKNNEDTLKVCCGEDCNSGTLFITEYSFKNTD